MGLAALHAIGVRRERELVVELAAAPPDLAVKSKAIALAQVE